MRTAHLQGFLKSITRKSGKNSQISFRQSPVREKVVVNRNSCSETEQFRLCEFVIEYMSEECFLTNTNNVIQKVNKQFFKTA